MRIRQPGTERFRKYPGRLGTENIVPLVARNQDIVAQRLCIHPVVIKPLVLQAVAEDFPFFLAFAVELGGILGDLLLLLNGKYKLWS